MLWGEAEVALSGRNGDVGDAVSDFLATEAGVKQVGVFSAEVGLAAMTKLLNNHKPSNKRVFGSVSEDEKS